MDAKEAQVWSLARALEAILDSGVDLEGNQEFIAKQKAYTALCAEIDTEQGDRALAPDPEAILQARLDVVLDGDRISAAARAAADLEKPQELQKFVGAQIERPAFSECGPEDMDAELQKHRA